MVPLIKEQSMSLSQYVRLKSSVKVARIVLDAIFFLTGFLLGGHIGLGTLIVLLLMGPSLEFTLNQLPKLKFFRVQEAK